MTTPSPPTRVLVLGPRANEDAESIIALCRERFAEVQTALGDWGDPFPEHVRAWRGDLLVSYLSRWIVPEALLSAASLAAINFHPGPPEFPGFGCYNFALYRGASHYGVSCHHMAPRVDTGPLIAVRRFPIHDSDDVASLIARTHGALRSLALEVLEGLADGASLPQASETWAGPPTTRRELDELSRITPDMSRDEMERRIRATSFGRWRPTLELHGRVFRLEGDDE